MLPFRSIPHDNGRLSFFVLVGFFADFVAVGFVVLLVGIFPLLSDLIALVNVANSVSDLYVVPRMTAASADRDDVVYCWI